MTRIALHLLASGARVLALVLIASIATLLLMRWAPGYFTDEREMDARYADSGRNAVELQQQREGSLLATLAHRIGSELHGDLGQSRHYGIPVAELLRERAGATARLVAESVFCGWTLALILGTSLSGRRTDYGEAFIAAPAALILAVPVGAMATLCLIADRGGPLLVLSLLVAVRDFKLLYRLMRRTWREPCYLYARALGMPAWRVVRSQLLPALSKELFALMMTSAVVALSLAVPVEVIFDIPGLGQLAWTAAMNRDLPVLLAVTLLMAACVGFAASFANPNRPVEAVQ